MVLDFPEFPEGSWGVVRHKSGVVRPEIRSYPANDMLNEC
jgi:hypothetical protein